MAVEAEMRELRSEYVIHAKLKNNLLLSRILERHENVNQFCEANGLSASEVGALVGLKSPALGRDGCWRPFVMRLADILGVMPEELFSEEQRTIELKTNEAFLEITRRQALAITTMDERVEIEDLARKILVHTKLTSNERQVVELVVMGDHTLDSVGMRLDLTRERIRQIEAKALRKMRKTMARIYGGV